MESKTRQRKRSAGFSLGEMLAVVVIGAMILTAILGIYSRVNQAAEAVLQRIESPSLAAEVLERIAADIDRALGADDVVVQIRNGFDNGFPRAELVLRRVFHDKDNKEQVLEEITWRAGYDHEGDAPGLILYRSREGKGQEDKLLEDQREDWEKNYPFVPVCRGLTYFQVQAYKGDELVDQWPPSAPPAGVKITISFAETYETVRGTRDVPDEEKIERTVVVDAIRKIRFALDSSGDANDVTDPNQEKAQEEPSQKEEPSRDKDRRTTGRGTEKRTTNEGATNKSTMTIRSPRGSTTNERTPTQTRPR